MNQIQLDLSNNLSISGKIVCDNIFSRILPPISFDTDRGWNIGGDAKTPTIIQTRNINDPVIPDLFIQSRHIADSAIMTRNLAYRSVFSDKIADNMILPRHIADLSLPMSKLLITDNSISGSKIADRSIPMSKILNFVVDISNGSIVGDKIANNAILTRHITNRSVIGDSIADNVILSRHIPDFSIPMSKMVIYDNSIPGNKIADRSIPMSKILNFVVDISNGSIVGDKIANSAIATRHIINRSVVGDSISDNAILSRHIPDRSIPMSKLVNFVVDVSNGSITSDKIAANAITSRHIADFSLPVSKLFIPDSSISGNKIANLTIGTRHIEDNAILPRHIEDRSIPISKLVNSIMDISNSSITSDKIADNAILMRHIPDRSIPMSKISNYVLDISNDAIATRHIAKHAIITEKIADGAINSYKISLGAITSDRIADGAIRTSNISDGAIVSDKIPNENILTAHLANQAITTNKVADLGITTAKIASGAITSDKITGGAINTAHIAYKSVAGDRIADTSIGTAHIQPKAITDEKMDDNSVIGRHIADGAITTSKIANGAITLKQLDPDILLDNETNVINNQTYKMNATIDGNPHHPNDLGARRICLSSDGKCLVASGAAAKSVYVYRSSMNVWNTSPVILTRTEANFGKYLDMSSDGSVIAVSDGITVWIYTWCVADFRWELQTQTITSEIFGSGLVRNMRLDDTGRRILIASHYAPGKNGIATYSVSSGALAIGIMNNQNTNNIIIGEQPEIAFSADANTVVLSDTSYQDGCGAVIIFDIIYGIRDRVETSSCFTGSCPGDNFGRKIAMNSCGSMLVISSGSSPDNCVAVYAKQTSPCSGWVPTRVFREREISRGIAIDCLSLSVDGIGKSVFIGYNGQYVAHAFKLDDSWSKVSQITNAKHTSRHNVVATNRDATSLVVGDLTRAGYGGVLSIYDIVYEPILITSSSGISLLTGTNGKVVLDGAGNVGIGTTPITGNKLYVAGNVNASGAITGNSDGRLKEKRENIINATDTVLKLFPQLYLKKPDFLSTDETEWQRESGLVAQDVWYQAPELRHLIGTGCDNSAIRDISGGETYSDAGWGETPATMNYIGLIPYLVRCIQEQNERIRVLEQGRGTYG
jgi:hypothetical protein